MVDSSRVLSSYWSGRYLGQGSRGHATAKSVAEGEGEGVFRQEVYYYNAQNCSVRYESAGVIDGDAHCETVYNSVKPDVNLNPVCRNKDVYFKLRK